MTERFQRWQRRHVGITVALYFVAIAVAVIGAFTAGDVVFVVLFAAFAVVGLVSSALLVVRRNETDSDRARRDAWIPPEVSTKSRKSD